MPSQARFRAVICVSWHDAAAPADAIIAASSIPMSNVLPVTLPPPRTTSMRAARSHTTLTSSICFSVAAVQSLHWVPSFVQPPG